MVNGHDKAGTCCAIMFFRGSVESAEFRQRNSKTWNESTALSSPEMCCLQPGPLVCSGSSRDLLSCIGLLRSHRPTSHLNAHITHLNIKDSEERRCGISHKLNSISFSESERSPCSQTSAFNSISYTSQMLPFEPLGLRFRRLIFRNPASFSLRWCT